MGSFGIAETASEKEKIKSEFADFINGMNSCGEIDYNIYSQLFDFAMPLFDKMFEHGKAKYGSYALAGDPCEQCRQHSDSDKMSKALAELEKKLRFILDECDWEEGKGDGRIAVACRNGLKIIDQLTEDE